MEPSTLGKIAHVIEDFAGRILEELGTPQRIDPDKFVRMLTTHPGAAAAHSISTLHLLQRMGEWRHEDETIHEYIHYNWAQMDGTLNAAFSDMATAKPLGWSAVERALRTDTGTGPLLLESLLLIPPRYHKFEGKLGRIEGVRYYPSEGIDVSIEYDRILHIVNRREIAALAEAPPYGVGDCGLAVKAWEAWLLIMAEWIRAGQRQATPLLFGKDDNTGRVPLLDDKGMPLKDVNGQPVMISGADRLLREMQRLNKNGGLVTGGLNSDMKVLNHQTDGAFFVEMMKYLDRLIAKAFLVPYTAMEEGASGFGNAELAHVQQSNMQLMLDQIAKQMQDEMTEKVIRPLIEWEFGEQLNYGKWEQPQDRESVEERKARIAELQALTAAFTAGVYSTADLEAINQHRHLAGLPPQDEIAPRLNNRYWRQAA